MAFSGGFTTSLFDLLVIVYPTINGNRRERERERERERATIP